MSRAEEKRVELLSLSKEIAARRQAIVNEYKNTHTLPSRGIIDTPELRELLSGEKRRYFEIIAKYKE